MPREIRVPLHDAGPALWPAYQDEQSLESIRRDMGTPLFNTMYQADPTALYGRIIPGPFRYGYASDQSTCYMTMDVAISEKKSADETAIVVGNIEPIIEVALGEFSFPLVTIRWVWHGRIGVKEQEQRIEAAWNYYRPVTVGIESIAYQSALLQWMTAEHPEIPVAPVSHDRDKWSRMLNLARLYEFSRIQHEPHLQSSAYEQQLTHLKPNGQDDMADAAEMLTRYAGITTAIPMQRPTGFR